MPDEWDAVSAIRRCPIVSWSGRAWRMHRQKYAGNDPGGSLKVSGRFHRAQDQFPPEESWPALYLALGPETCLGELVRHVTPEMLPHLNNYRMSELMVSLSVVADCRAPRRLGISPSAMIDDDQYDITQQLGAAVHEAALEGLFVPSATGLEDSLVVFVDHLRPHSQIAVVSSRDPRLYADRH